MIQKTGRWILDLPACLTIIHSHCFNFNSASLLQVSGKDLRLLLVERV